MSESVDWPRSLNGFFACASVALLGACGLDTNPVHPVGSDPGPRFNCLFPASQIFDGGVGRDEVPALNLPHALPATDAALHDTTRVLGVEITGLARAYPLPVLWWHEIVNDTLGNRPIVVTYCPLTGSGLVFDPIVAGAAAEFGVTGLLFENNLIMFDRETESFWPQLLMGAQCGIKSGTPLNRVPVIETTWGHWKALHPNTTVMTDQTGIPRPYGVYPYGNYDEPTNAITLVPSSPWNHARPPKELTLGVRLGQFSAAYPFGLLEELGSVAAVNEHLGPQPLLVTWVGSERTARAFFRRVGGTDLTFDVVDSAAPTFADRETTSTWNLRGEAVAGPLTGTRLKPVTDSWTLFWFSWSVFYPGTRVFVP